MEMASQLLPIIFYLLLCILIVVAIVFFYKLIITVDKTNVLLDDVYSKVKKLDNLFEIIDKGSDTLNLITNKATETVVNFFVKLFRRKKEDDDYE